jgi:hypothetical protein
MSQAPATARGLLERTGEHPVISVYFDLDPGVADEVSSELRRSGGIAALLRF